MENRNGLDFAIGPEDATTAALGDVFGSGGTREKIGVVVLCVGDGRGAGGTLKVERGAHGTNDLRAFAI